jgi:hypothetical protein
MKTVRLVLLALVAAIFSTAHAASMDRSAEIARYMEAIGTASNGSMILAAREIYGSGISDAKLAAALIERLERDVAKLSSNREDSQFGVFMVRAIASQGLVENAEALKRIKSLTKNSKTRGACDDELKLQEWHIKRVAIMADESNHREGDNPRISGLVSLLKNDDYSYKYWAVERMNWDKVLDARLMATIAPQVQAYIDAGKNKFNSQQDDTIANFVKLLGYSKDTQYRPLLEKVLASPTASSAVKRHAKYSLDRLW